MSDILSILNNLVSKHTRLTKAYASEDQFKEAIRSVIQYPVLVLSDDPQLSFFDFTDRLFITETHTIHILDQPASRKNADIALVQARNRQLLRDFCGYIMLYNESIREDPVPAGAYFNLDSLKARPARKWLSDGIEGFTLSISRTQPEDLRANPESWNASIP